MNIYLQKDAMDCGPSCLAMIAKHYGKQFDQGILRDLCKTLSLEICLYNYFFVPLSYETATLLSQLCRPVSRSA